MCRLSSSRFWLFALLITGLLFGPRLALAEIVQEKLGADGFPASWGAAEFNAANVSGTVVSATVATSGTTPARAPRLQRGWNTDAVGALKPGKGGVAPDVWRQMTRTEAEAALNRALNKGSASPALREAWRIVLSTAAAPPVMPEKGSPSSWLAVRSEALDKLGLYETGWVMWKDISAEDVGDDEASQLAWVKSRMLAGDGEHACAFAKAEAVKETSGNRWAPVMAACQLVGQGANPAAVQLSLQVVEPQLKAENPALLRVLEAVTDGRVVSSLPAENTAIDALGGAVLGQFPALLGPAIMPRVPDLALRRVVQSDALPEAVRGQAAVALAGQTGLADDGALAWRLVSSTALAGDIADAVLVAKGVKDASGTQVLDYVAAALRLGQVDAAVKVLPQVALPNDASAGERRQLAQVRLATGLLQGKVADVVWDEWIIAQALENSVGVKAAQRTLLVAEALSVPVPQRIWTQLRTRAVAVSTVTDPAWQRVLADAVTNANMPQVLVLISEAWSGEPVAEVAPIVAGASVEALRKIGFEPLARRVAAEALLGVPRKPLVALKIVEEPLAPVSGTTEAPSRTVVQGLNSVGLTRRVTDTDFVLPPPRVMPVAKPTVTAPSKPTVPGVGN